MRQTAGLAKCQFGRTPAEAQPTCLYPMKESFKEANITPFLDIHDSLIVNAIGIRSCGDNVTALFCGGGFCDIGRCGYTIHYNIE